LIFCLILSAFLLLGKVYQSIKKRKWLFIDFLSSNSLFILIFFVLIWVQFYFKSFESEIGWELRLKKAAFPLKGKNIEIVPPEKIGFFVDSSCDRVIRDNSYLYNPFAKNIRVNNDEIVHTTTFFYVSEDFDGDSVKIIVNGAVERKEESIYRLVNTHEDNLKENNLILNGNFEMGTTYWMPYADSTQLKQIKTPFGKGVRVIRGDGDGGNWSLRYIGRPILFHAGHTFLVKFKFKVQKGIGLPFYIGWWVDVPNYGFARPLEIKELIDGWKEASCTYKFKETYNGKYFFLNSLQDFSVVDFADVEVSDLNRNEDLPFFDDQTFNKGSWQKLEINSKGRKGKLSLNIKISKNAIHNSKSFKGYVIFTKPEINVVSLKE
jgi:hypothetical protein